MTLSRLIRRPELASALGALVIFIFFMIVAPAFRSLDAFATTLYASSTLGIVALAVGLLMIGDEFDLSSGVAVTTTALITGQVATPRISDMQGFDSAEMVFAGAVTIFGVNVRVTVFWWIFFVILASILLFKTKFGNWIFAVGGNQESARAVGVPVRRVKITLFMFVGFAAWFVGMHTLFAFDSIQAGNGVGNEFLYIIAAVIGGCALTGGRGTAIGTAIGALIFGMTNQGIVYAGWNPDWFKFFLGAMLLFAVLVNSSFGKITTGRQE